MPLYVIASQCLVISDDREEALIKFRKRFHGMLRPVDIYKVSDRNEAPIEWLDLDVIGGE